jgi:hypothetical protein
MCIQAHEITLDFYSNISIENRFYLTKCHMRNEMCCNSGFEFGSSSGIVVSLLATAQNAEGRAELQANEAERSWLPAELEEAVKRTRSLFVAK